MSQATTISWRKVGISSSSRMPSTSSPSTSSSRAAHSSSVMARAGPAAAVARRIIVTLARRVGRAEAEARPPSRARRSLSEPLDGAPEAVREGHLRPPAEDVGGAPGVDDAAALLAGLRGSVTDLGAAARRLEEEARERVHVGLDAGADVEGPGRGGLEREEVGARHVADVHVVARLLAVTVHRDRFGAEHPPREDGDHARLSVRVLARAVDVGVAQRHEGELVLGLVEEGVELARPLADAVGGDGVGGMRLGRGECLLLAVGGAAGGHEEDAADVRLARRLEQVDGAEDVDARVEERIGDRAAHVHLRRVEVQHRGARVADQFAERGIGDVEPVEAGLGVQVLAAAGREVVDDDHLVAGRDVGVDHVRADEARPTRHQYLHALRTTGRKKSIVLRSPSSSATWGSQPSSVRALVMSGWRTLGSSSGRGRNTISLFEPVSALIRSANWRIEISIGLPQLTGSLWSERSRRTSPSTRSDT